jgi:hypothetical protein
MKLQNILRTNAMLFGFGAALLLASSAPAQEIDNPTWSEGSNSVSFSQPSPAYTAGDLGSAVTASDAAIANSLATQEALVSPATPAQSWIVLSLIICFALAALYMQVETRHRKRKRDAHRAGRLNTRTAIS